MARFAKWTKEKQQVSEWLQLAGRDAEAALLVRHLLADLELYPADCYKRHPDLAEEKNLRKFMQALASKLTYTDLEAVTALTRLLAVYPEQSEEIVTEVWEDVRASVRKVQPGEELLIELPDGYLDTYQHWAELAKSQESAFPPFVYLPLVSVLTLVHQVEDPVARESQPAVIDAILRSIMTTLDLFKMAEELKGKGG